MNHIVLLRRDHPGLSGHVSVSVCQSSVHRIRVCPILEFSLSEPKGRRERSDKLFGSMAIGANPLIDLPPTLISLLIRLADHSGMIQIRFIFRYLDGQKGHVRLKGRGPLRARIADFDQVLHKV